MRLIQMGKEGFGISGGRFKFAVRCGDYNFYRVTGLDITPLYPIRSACFKLEFLYE